MRKLLAAALLIPASIITFSCSGGGGGGNDNDNMNTNGNVNGNTNTNTNTNGNTNGGGGGSGQTGTISYLFYTGSLYYINPTDNPQTPQELVDTPVSDYFSVIIANSYDTATNHYSGMHTKYVVYITNRKIYKANAEVSSGTPTPVQVSNINDACEFVDYFTEGLEADDSYAIVRRAGTDTNCGTGDDTYSLVKLSMSNTDSPIGLNGKEIIESYAKQETEVIQGFLVKDGNALKACSEDLSSCSTLKSGISSVELIGEYDFENKKYLLNIDGDLYSFNGATEQLSNTPVLSGYSGEDELIDNNAMYFLENTISAISATSRIKKLNFSDWSVDTLYEKTSSLPLAPIQTIAQTNNYIVFGELSESTPGTADIKVISKSGGSAQTITTGVGAGAPLSVGNKIFYSYGTNTGPKYCHWTEGNSSASCTDGYISGFSLAQSGTISLAETFPAHRILVVEGCTLTPESECTGGTLKAIDPNNMNKTEIGNVPNDAKYMYAGGIGDYLLGIIGVSSGSETKGDIVFVDLQTPELLRITNTPAVDEQIVF